MARAPEYLRDSIAVEATGPFDKCAICGSEIGPGQLRERVEVYFGAVAWHEHCAYLARLTAAEIEANR